jgi:hypothetical protein
LRVSRRLPSGSGAQKGASGSPLEPCVKSIAGLAVYATRKRWNSEQEASFLQHVASWPCVRKARILIGGDSRAATSCALSQFGAGLSFRLRPCWA